MAPVVTTAAHAAGEQAKTPSEPPATATSNTVAITSPMVGRSIALRLGRRSLREMGDKVEVGQTICIVEAMKLMNEIEAEVRGRIVQILVENAQPVEFGQTPFLVEPA
jgi:acetyl-CoA carboxylase biotin carboxyl carrier protein